MRCLSVKDGVGEYSNVMCVCVCDVVVREQELELVEDVWRGEAQDLLSQIAQLQEENKSLLTNMSIKEPMSEEDLQRHEGEDVHAKCSSEREF